MKTNKFCDFQRQNSLHQKLIFFCKHIYECNWGKIIIMSTCEGQLSISKQKFKYTFDTNKFPIFDIQYSTFYNSNNLIFCFLNWSN